MEDKNINLVSLGKYILQKDRRVRMPTQVLENLPVVAGKTFFKIFLNPNNGNIVFEPIIKKRK